jgi:O-antigen ligase
MIARRARYEVISKSQASSRVLDWAYLFPLILLIGYIFIIQPALAVSSRPASRATEVSKATVYEGRTIQVVKSTAFMLALLGLLVPGNAMRHVFHRQKLMLLLVIYALLSATWSISPNLSLQRSLQFAGLLVVAWCAIRTTSAIERIVRVLRWVLTSALCLSFPLVILKGQMSGIYTHKNVLGQFVLLSIALWLPCLGSKGSLAESRLAPLVLLLAAFLAVKIGSKTALVTTVLMVGLYVLLKLPIPWEIKIITTYVPIAIGTLWFLNFQQFPFAAFMTDVIQSDVTFTGRVFIWKSLLNNMHRHLLLGEGYDAFWSLDNFRALRLIYSSADWRPVQGHNGYLDLFNELGLIGGTLFLLVLIQSVVRATRLYFLQGSTGMVFLLLLFGIMLTNVTESGFCRGVHQLWIVFLLTYVAVSSIHPSRLPGRSRSIMSAQGRKQS